MNKFFTLTATALVGLSLSACSGKQAVNTQVIDDARATAYAASGTCSDLQFLADLEVSEVERLAPLANLQRTQQVVGLLAVVTGGDTVALGDTEDKKAHREAKANLAKTVSVMDQKGCAVSAQARELGVEIEG